jgi:hypothetical protein
MDLKAGLRATLPMRRAGTLLLRISSSFPNLSLFSNLFRSHQTKRSSPQVLSDSYLYRLILVDVKRIL